MQGWFHFNSVYDINLVELERVHEVVAKNQRWVHRHNILQRSALDIVGVQALVALDVHSHVKIRVKLNYLALNA